MMLQACVPTATAVARTAQHSTATKRIHVLFPCSRSPEATPTAVWLRPAWCSVAACPRAPFKAPICNHVRAGVLPHQVAVAAP